MAFCGGQRAGWTPIASGRWSRQLDAGVAVIGTFLEAVEHILSGFPSTGGSVPGATVCRNNAIVPEDR